MSPRLPLAVLFASLMTACEDKPLLTDSDCNHSCCGFEGGSFDTEGTYLIDQATYEAALSEDDTLSAEACEQLCRDNHWYADAILSMNDCVDEGQDENGEGSVWCAWEEEEYCEGRAHAGVARATRGEGPDPVAAWLSRAALAEAGSACAFARLRWELLQHDAPDALLMRCAAAARDEIGHAREVRGLAAARGAHLAPVAEVPYPPRSLEALATENAVEGCVGETWAALQAVHQARAAADPRLRVTMARIAEDETRHAELARDLHAWFLSQLDAAAAQRVEAARVAAWGRLAERLKTRGEDPAELGLPSAGDTARMIEGLSVAWAA